MLEKLRDGDIVITTREIKNALLKAAYAKKMIINLKFYTLQEFLNNYFGKVNKKALYFLMKHYNFNYDVACSYLENIFFDVLDIKKIREVLDSNNLIYYNPNFKKTIKRVVVIGIKLDKYLEEELKFYDFLYLEPYNSNNQKLPVVYEFAKEEDEVTYVASQIRSLTKNGVKLNDICLVNVGREYYPEIERTFNWFGIPINLYLQKNIFGTKMVQDFLDALKRTRKFEDAIDAVLDIEIKNKIIDLINSYELDDAFDLDDTFIDLITNDLKKLNVSLPKYDNAVSVIDFSSMLDDNKYYFVMNFNQGVVPRVFKDDKLIKDVIREKIGLKTSLDLLVENKLLIKNILNSFTHLCFTYKEKDKFSTYYPSPMIVDLGLVIEKPKLAVYNLSNEYNKIQLARYLDNYVKYNEQDEMLADLLQTYSNIPYNTYDNSYIKVDFDDLYSYLKGKSNLSYSSMNNYFLCAFRFYIANILKLDPFMDNFAAFLGSLFHDVLSKMYQDDFDLSKEYNSYLQKRELTVKEKFYCDKLYATLEFIIQVIREQESKSLFNKTLTEQHISLKYNGKLAINFLGFVDKIKYLEGSDGKWLVAIIDYKTGYVPTTLDNINYGLHLQLPVYIYLTKNGLHKDIKIVGFYLQKILNGKEVDSEDNLQAAKNALKLDGYSLDSEEDIIRFDNSYSKSEVIKGMALTSKGFAHYTKLVSSADVDKIALIVDEKIKEVIKAMEDCDFSINPKRIKGELVGCEYCKYKEVCYRREENIVDLEYKTRKEILGDDEHAQMDE
ncbi:MAG: PD-(D/E)XK nuclease family protein [bacterium]|nr:PD-(D/E)XK nuclease family protein [bacterium]